MSSFTPEQIFTETETSRILTVKKLLDAYEKEQLDFLDGYEYVIAGTCFERLFDNAGVTTPGVYVLGMSESPSASQIELAEELIASGFQRTTPNADWIAKGRDKNILSLWIYTSRADHDQNANNKPIIYFTSYTKRQQVIDIFEIYHQRFISYQNKTLFINKYAYQCVTQKKVYAMSEVAEPLVESYLTRGWTRFDLNNETTDE